MIILHLSLCNDHLFVWGEEKCADISFPKPRGRKPRNPPPRSHPFAAGQEVLEAALSEHVELGEATQCFAYLPSTERSPLPSAPILGDVDVKGEEIAISRWKIDGYRLGVEQIEELLAHTSGKTLLKEGVLVGNTFAFFEELFYFGLSLVIRQRFLPGINGNHGRFQATWQPVFMGKDRERFQELVDAFPAVSRALSSSFKQQQPPARSPEMLIKDYVSSLMAYAAEGQQQEEVPRTIHDAWLHHLQSESTTLQGDQREVNHCKQQIDEWKQPITLLYDAPFRLCFRLEEPVNQGDMPDIAASGGPWHLRYLMQSQKDPSLLVDIAHVWNPKGVKRRLLSGEHFNARYYLLTALGVAAGMFPPINKSLEVAQPEGLTLSSEEAYRFLSGDAALFEDAGFGVILPAWWVAKEAKKKLVFRAEVTSPKMRAPSQKSMWELLQVDWKLALAGQELTLNELHALAQLKEALIQVRGQWVCLSQEEIEAAIAFWERQQSRQMSVQEVLQLAMGAQEVSEGIEVSEVTASGWIAELLDRIQGKVAMEQVPLPKGFQGTLRPYQRDGFSWLVFMSEWGMGACLADDMGLGKTPQTLAAIQHFWESSQERSPSLLVCPTSLVGNWQKEARKFAPDLPIYVHYGSDRCCGDEFVQATAGAALVISSYPLLHRDSSTFEMVKWNGVVLDESQSIKNPSAKQSKAAFALEARFRFALTGTPVENHVGDLWSIMHFVNPGFLGSERAFKRHFHTPIHSHGSEEATDQLKRMTAPFILRRVKTDQSIIQDLPDKIERDTICSLSREQASLYAAVIEETTKSLQCLDDSIERKGIILSTLMKLKQICNHPAQFLKDRNHELERSGKLLRLVEIIEEILELNESVLIFSQFFEMGALIQESLERHFGREVLFLHGAVKKKGRDRMVDRFQGVSGPKIFVLSLKAGGTGLTLTHANHVIHYDRWWNPAVENQATDRAYRIGQKKNVQVQRLLCQGTLEDHIADMISSKEKVAKSIIGAGEGWLTELSTEELSKLWALRDYVAG